MTYNHLHYTWMLLCLWIINLFFKFLFAGNTVLSIICQSCVKKPSKNILSQKLQPPSPHHYLVYVLLGGLQDVPPTDYNYSLYSHRLASFRNWPTDNTMSPYRLAHNGFFFIDSGFPCLDDSVICHACFSTISDWRQENDILQRHRDSSPNCPFLRSRTERTYASHLEATQSVHSLNQNHSVQQPSWLIDGNDLQAMSLFSPSTNEAQQVDGVQESFFPENHELSSSSTPDSNQPASSSFVTAEQASFNLEQTVSLVNETSGVMMLPLDTMTYGSQETNIVRSLHCQEADGASPSSLCTSGSHHSRFDEVFDDPPEE
ncbi:hypothetical protein Btru_052822 [Bulinus truncatus]|nr:hypothetical protein Btru_052822 [Bulinus truncatus]